MVDYVLKTSLEIHQVITIVYKKGNEFTQRNVKVTNIADNSVEAYCYLRRQVRKFKKDNILSASLYSH